MLEHVALGQSRFMTPGVAPDPRGVLLGRYGVLVFPTLEGVVAWFRLYSSESSLDELLPGMLILQMRTPLQSREMVVRIPATSSYAMDRAARCAHLVGGSAYTGTGKHFVKYRDERSPYGYDATEIKALPAGSDLMLHGDDFTQTYAREGELAFDNLLFRLSLRRQPGADRLADDERNELVLVIARGLGEGVVRYLWRNRVDAEVGLVRPRGKSAFDDLGRRKSYLLARVHELPARILDLFLATPGIDVFRPVASNVAVHVGYSHVIDLGSCTSVFEQQGFYVFWGGQDDRVDVVDGPLELSGIEHLTSIDIDLETPDGQQEAELEQVEAVGVRVELSPSLNPLRHVVGTLIPNERADWIKRLVFMLPPSSLRGHRVAVTDRGILLVATSDTDIVPLGQLLSEIAPGLLVPIGMELVPRVAPDVLARSLGHGAGVYTVFPHDGQPFQVSESAFAPLERRALAKIEVTRAESIDMTVAALGDPSVVNDPVGRFALWGFSTPPEK
jgi:hypothetical protein